MNAAVPVVVAGGSPEQIGQAHGAALATLIHRHLVRWKTELARRRGGDADALIDGFMERSAFVTTVTRMAPEITAEVESMAVAADITRRDAWFLQLMDETWRHAGLLAAEHCTSLAVLSGQSTVAAQTMDLEPFRLGAQAVLDLRPDSGARQLIVTMAGAVGLLGVSAAGFAVCVNALSQVPTSDDGMPVAMIVRCALAQPDVAAAERFLRQVPHASGQHYLLAAHDRVVSLECSAAGAVAVPQHGAATWHTNHPLVGYSPTTDDHDSIQREQAASAELTDATDFDDGMAMALLTEPPIYKLPDATGDTCTFAAVTIELSNSGSRLTVAVDPHDGGDCLRLSLP